MLGYALLRKTENNQQTSQANFAQPSLTNIDSWLTFIRLTDLKLVKRDTSLTNLNLVIC